MRPGIFQVIISIAILVLLFGSNRVIEWARALGKAKGEFTKALKESSI